ncbi:thiol peroxidase [Vibrio sp.]|uniref:thiol peroxidase n=1 Tax=Vibrio sp. TaxID=678 RepID=UPI00311D95BA
MSVTFFGNPVTLDGTLPKVQQSAPNFRLCDNVLDDLELTHFKGKKLLLNIFPSVDTPVCANSVRGFNLMASELDNTVVLCVSNDLPFTLTRFVDEFKLENVEIASCFKAPEFAVDYGVSIIGGALTGLTSRAVVVINEEGVVEHVQLVNEISEEPDYQSAKAALLGECA